MKWNWQHEKWPHFTYKTASLLPLEQEFLHQSGMLFGAYHYLSKDDKDRIKVEIFSREALKTSEIEGEYLDRESLQSSIRRQFGLQAIKQKIAPSEKGMAELMLEVYKSFEPPLDHDTLYRWHGMVMAERTDVITKNYRTSSEPMQIVSGKIYEPKIHFEAPPSNKVKKEMNRFMTWFNDSAPTGKSPLPPLTRASLAHIYFESIHPFEDGNGRIGRALSEKCLAQGLNKPTLIGLSSVIHKHRKKYYDALEIANKKIEMTEWLLYFSKTILEAVKETQNTLEFLIQKTKFFEHLPPLNHRQEKLILRLFKEGPEGISNGITAQKYINLTKTSRATATRDLTELVEIHALTKKGELKHTKYFLNLKKEK